MKEGNEAAHRAKRGVRQAVVRAAEVVACTLSSAGGDLLSLVKGAGADPSMLFNAIMIDEVQIVSSVTACSRPEPGQDTPSSWKACVFLLL